MFQFIAPTLNKKKTTNPVKEKELNDTFKKTNKTLYIKKNRYKSIDDLKKQ